MGGRGPAPAASCDTAGGNPAPQAKKAVEMGLFNRKKSDDGREVNQAPPAQGSDERSSVRAERPTQPQATERAVAPDPAPEPEAAAAIAEGPTGESGMLEKGELRRAVNGGGNGTAPEPVADDEADRVAADELIVPAPERRHPLTPERADEPSGARMKVYAFANQKGGVAKTTTTLNLAVALSESGHDVLCVDLDPQGNLTMSQGIDPEDVDKSMYDVLVHRIPIREVIHEREVDIAVSSIDLAGAEIAMSTQIGRERSLQKALAAVADDYDYVCIDTPPSLGLLTINALTAADKVIVPVQCEYLSMRGLVQLQNTLQMIRENLNPDVEIEGILPTMLDSRTVHAKEAVEILEENFGELVFKSRIKKAIKFAEAPVKGSSVLKYDPDGNAAQYYRDLAEEVLTHGSST
jgi:chromosome partitioning protein